MLGRNRAPREWTLPSTVPARSERLIVDEDRALLAYRPSQIASDRLDATKGQGFGTRLDLNKGVGHMNTPHPRAWRSRARVSQQSGPVDSNISSAGITSLNPVCWPASFKPKMGVGEDTCLLA
ncbi:hypothetical protein PsYK624_045140 [Phanerochaete sordida]|uniref:Uncharacterized protein n=1 Tax=Phanerochaete sordida TaxID=48140 RepID=A0A9P3G527_9APHY|nr:hypothetical protein PsYK624_045140 [Phanerochaete sordida]